MKRATRIMRKKWLRWWFIVKPTAATSHMWGRWRVLAKRRRPVRYFLQETLPGFFRREVYRLTNLRWWFIHRTIERYHVIDLGLKPGYYDIDTQLLNANFSLMQTFVEVHLASKNWSFFKENKLPRPPRWGNDKEWRATHGKASGLDMIAFYCSDENRVGSPENAKAMEALKRIYEWWTIERPARIEPHDDPRIWAGIERDNFFSAKRPKKDNSAYRRAVEISADMQAWYDDQDTEMLKRLISLRRHLWA